MVPFASERVTGIERRNGFLEISVMVDKFL